MNATHTAKTSMAALAVMAAALVGGRSTAEAHKGHGEAAMWEACEGAKIDDGCSFENARHDVFRGTCRAVSAHLVCVRNKPIEPAEENAGLLANATKPPGRGMWMALALILFNGVLFLALLVYKPTLRPKTQSPQEDMTL